MWYVIFKRFRKKKIEIIIEKEFIPCNPLLVITTRVNNSNYIIMDLSLLSNQKSLGKLTVLDNDTLQPISASLANIVVSISDTSLFDAIIDAIQATVSVVAKAAGSGSLGVTADATYIDSKTSQTVTKTLSLTVAVIITLVVTAENVSLQISFADPVDQ